MSWPTRLKRLTFLIHRWMGVAGCVVMLVWFVSGITMLFVGYPKLTPWERLGALPELDAGAWREDVSVTGLDATGALTLTSIGGEPHVVQRTNDGWSVLSTRHGQPTALIDPDFLMAEAAAFQPRATLQYRGAIQEDRWTHSRRLDAHRPLHRIDWDGATRGTLYLSSVTGQVVLDAPLWQQRWNYVGAWLHWLYFMRNTSTDPVWTWIVIALSTLGTVAGISGALVGVWRWRFRGTYKTGSKSPFREPWMRWHHWTGLLFGTLVCTWIFSGLMSMNPFGIFTSDSPSADIDAYRGTSTLSRSGLTSPAQIMTTLTAEGLRPVELQWHTLAGEPYVLAYEASGASRIVRQQQGRLTVARHFDAQDVMPAARRLYPAAVHAAVIEQADAYYYPRHPEAMNGANLRGLPALRLDFDDPHATRVYIDLRTGKPEQILSRPERVGRWLFYFLHSWDIPPLLALKGWRDAVLILLSIGGIAITASGVVLGWRRVMIVRKKRRC